MASKTCRNGYTQFDDLCGGNSFIIETEQRPLYTFASLLLPIIAQNAFQYRVQVDRKEYVIENKVQKGVSERKSQATKREFPRLMAIAPVEISNVQGENPLQCSVNDKGCRQHYFCPSSSR